MGLTADYELELFTWGDDDWRTKAACRGSDTSQFFPIKGRKAAIDNAKARLICMTCPVDVRKECLRFAVKNNITFGVYGGHGATNRRQFDADNITDDSVLVPLTEVYATLKRAMDPAPVEAMARLFNQSEEWVHTQMSNGADYRI